MRSGFPSPDVAERYIVLGGGQRASLSLSREALYKAGEREREKLEVPVVKTTVEGTMAKTR